MDGSRLLLRVWWYGTNKAVDCEQHKRGLLLCLVFLFVRCDAIIGESVTALESR